MDKKAKALIKAVEKFRTVSYKLIQAAIELQRHDAGSRGYQKAVDRHMRLDCEFDRVDEALDAAISEVKGDAKASG